MLFTYTSISLNRNILTNYEHNKINREVEISNFVSIIYGTNE